MNNLRLSFLAIIATIGIFAYLPANAARNHSQTPGMPINDWLWLLLPIAIIIGAVVIFRKSKASKAEKHLS